VLEKAKRNLREHGVSVEEAATVFLDLQATTYADPDHSNEEDREITIGYSTNRRLLFVSRVERRNRTRSVSAREASRRERKQHEQSNGEENG
jgi:hypothetical protein